jgi:catechol 2,3-dioxygenase-like lactoylglutathione lyase family enzyme
MGIVTLGVADLGRSEAFYSALGWRRAESSVPGEITWFETTHSWLGLFGRDELAEDAGVPPTASAGFSGVTLAVNVESEAAVDRAMAAAVGAGATVTQPAARLDWGGYRGYFADPDGHLWEIAHNPSFPIDENGRVVIP